MHFRTVIWTFVDENESSLTEEGNKLCLTFSEYLRILFTFFAVGGANIFPQEEDELLADGGRRKGEAQEQQLWLNLQ